MNDIRTREQETKEKRAKAKNDAFHNFMDEPMTRLAITNLGEAAKSETFNLLLSAAFDKGSDHGSGQVASEFADAIIKGMMNKEKPRAA